MPRVSLLAVCAAATALLISGQSAPKAKPTASKANPTASVGVFMDFDRDSAPGDAPLEIMKDEVDKLLNPSGVKLNWHLAKENRGNQAFSGLVVLKFRGKCRVEGWNSPVGMPTRPDFGSPGEVTTLGFTRVSGGKVLPYSEVECDEIKKALAYLPAGTGKKEKQRALGLAMGRVVAHELYHVLASTTAHAARGLAEATESLDDLISPAPLGFDVWDSQAIGQAFAAAKKP